MAKSVYALTFTLEWSPVRKQWMLRGTNDKSVCLVWRWVDSSAELDRATAVLLGAAIARELESLLF